MLTIKQHLFYFVEQILPKKDKLRFLSKKTYIWQQLNCLAMTCCDKTLKRAYLLLWCVCVNFLLRVYYFTFFYRKIYIKFDVLIHFGYLKLDFFPFYTISLHLSKWGKLGQVFLTRHFHIRHEIFWIVSFSKQ